MTKSEIENARDKFMVAVHGMATSDAPLRERLIDAMVTVLALANMPDGELRAQFRELDQRTSGRDGALDTTIRLMTEEELRSCAELLCSIHEGLTYAGDRR